MERPPVVCVAQQKGGVCKTTTVLSVSAGLAATGKSILMVDLDPQANLTRNILDYESVEGNSAMLYGGKAEVNALIRETRYPGLLIIPARTSLSRVENLERTISSFTALKREIPKIEREFDAVFIDTPPSLGLFTVSALLAASHVLVPVQPTFFCQEGLGDLNATISEARENNPGLRSVRYFITLYDRRTVIGQELVGMMEEQLGDQLLKSRIRKNVSLEESQYAQRSIFDYAPGSPGASDYQNLSKEVGEWLASS